MFSSFLNPSSGGRVRSKSPSARVSRESNDHYSTPDDERNRYRKPSRSKYSETESEDDLIPDTPRYEERTPDAYVPRASKDERSTSRRADEYEEDPRYSRKSSKKTADEDYENEPMAKTSRRRERDYRDYTESPRSPRPSAVQYANGDPSSYAAYTRSNDVPGAFPSQTPTTANPYTQPRKPGQYADPGKFQYAQPDPNAIQYNYNDNGRQPSYSKHYEAVPAAPNSHKPTRPSASIQQKQYIDDTYRAESARPRPAREASDDLRPGRQPEQGSLNRRNSYQRERSPNPTPADQLRQSLGRLSTSGPTLGVIGATPTGERPPASPLLEAYKGTYQTISPLPSPMSLAVRRRDEDISDVSLSDEDDSDDDDPITKKIRALEKEKKRVVTLKKLDSADTISPRSSGSKLDAPTKKSRTLSTSKPSKAKKSVSFYDPEADAEKLADALKGSHRSPDIKPLLKILPWLTTDEILTLKTSYKNHAKINGQGINLSKHIKARIPGNLGKVLYATSLGQYESDAYWANCFYQSGASRRELLIESLVGRSNQQIREIKDVFKDKRYDDDLEKCMKAELKADKFRMAILLALDERRMPEGLGINMKLVHEDGLDLYQALHGVGGVSESTMINIVMKRSDEHLREVLRYYEKSYRRNFARDMLARSQNLAGETLAHILNGALNRPMRDAILLHQAIDEFAPQPATAVPRTTSPNNPLKPPAGRAELLISRVVRSHWEPKHLERVKREYAERYGETVVRALTRDVQGGMKTEEGKMWAGFVIDLIRSSEQG